MYRPKGWENPFPDEPREHIRGGVHNAYEAGADAMLEALRKETEEPNYTEDLNQRVLRGNGKLVFIPDEEKRNG